MSGHRPCGYLTDLLLSQYLKHGRFIVASHTQMLAHFFIFHIGVLAAASSSRGICQGV